MVSLFREDPKHILKTINAHLPVDPRSLAKSVPLPNTEAPGFSPIYRNAFSPDALLNVPYPGLDTLYKLFEYAVDVHGNKPALGSGSRILMALLAITYSKIMILSELEETILDQGFSLFYKIILIKLIVMPIKIEIRSKF